MSPLFSSTLRRLGRIGLVPLLFIALPASAAGLKDTVLNNFYSVGKAGGLITNPESNTASVLDFFGLYFSTALGFGGVVFLVQVVHGGYTWMTAGGNEEKIKAATARIRNGAIGVVIVFFAYLLTAFIVDYIASQAGVLKS